MSFYDTMLNVASNTIGLGWDAVGATNPFRVEEQARQEAFDILKAKGLDPNDSNNSAALDEAYVSAKEETIKVMESTPKPQIDCSKPQSDILSGLYCDLKKFETYLVVIVIIIIAIYLLSKQLSSPRLIVRRRI